MAPLTEKRSGSLSAPASNLVASPNQFLELIMELAESG
jgi:hypothetical protein